MSWLERLWGRALELRIRVLSHPGFQRWAAANPLTRPVADRRATALFDLCAGFVYSQVLFACTELRLLERLARGPVALETLAAEIPLPPDGLRRLVEAAISLKLVERRPGDQLGLGIHGASYAGNPAVAAMVEHHALLYRDLADPLALLRGEVGETEIQRFWTYARPRPEGDAAPYSELMARSLGMLAEDLLEAYPVTRHRRLMDVGGGQGELLGAIAARPEAPELVLFDLPPVAARAGATLAARGLGDRVRVIGGDVFVDPLPRGADLVSLVRVLHDHDDDAAMRILRAVRDAIEPGGTVLVAEPMGGAEPAGEAYFGFYLLAMGQGRPRTPAQLSEMLRDAGFTRPRLRATRRPMLARMITASSPA